MQYNYVLVVGEGEHKDRTVTIRARGSSDQHVATVDKFVQQLRTAVERFE